MDQASSSHSESHPLPSRNLNLPHDFSSAKERSRTASPAECAVSSPRNLKSLNKRNFRGETQLHIAAQKGDVPLCRKLVEDGADINSADNAGWTPLHEACAYAYYEMAEFLISKGADVNIASSDGVCPLHDAVQSNNPKLVWLLLKEGADRTKRSARGHLPIEMNQGNDKIDRLLTEPEIIELYPYESSAGSSENDTSSDRKEPQQSESQEVSSSSSGSGTESSASESGADSSASSVSSRSGTPLDGTLVDDLDETLKEPNQEPSSTTFASTSVLSIEKIEKKISPTISSKFQSSVIPSTVKALSSTYSPEKLSHARQNRKRPARGRANNTPLKHDIAQTSASSAVGSSTGDIYEFHSSPESNDIPSISSSLQKSSSGSGIVTTSMNIELTQTHSNPASSNMVPTKTTSTPPPKRIKTAALAKELLAAAAASGSPLLGSSNFGTPKSETSDDGYLPKASSEPQGLSQQSKSDSSFEVLDGPEQEAHASVSIISGGDVQAETKKVPPLRILLPKTPSEEDASSEPNHSPVASTLNSSKKRGTQKHTTGKKHHHRHSDKKDDTQRITRSRVRQTGANLEETSTKSGQKRSKGNNGSRAGTAEPGGRSPEEDNGVMQEADIPDDENSRSDAGEVKDGEENTNQAPTSSMASSVTALLLSKNSCDQTLEFDKMIKEKWARGFRDCLQQTYNNDPIPEGLEKLMNNFEIGHNTTKSEPNVPLIVKVQETWPDALQKLAIEQAQRREQLEMAHKAERDRLYKFGERELVRIMRRTAARSHSDINIVRLLRDSELYNPAALDAFTEEPPQMQLMTKAQLLQRLKHMAFTTKNRHTMEAHSLYVCQQAEWNKAARKLCSQNSHDSASPKWGNTVSSVSVEETTFPFMHTISERSA
ncbi:ankyrin repeats (3 copies) domain-containing protein [Ditylenchus destructor]|nr:ankyrin repeats (3 copies) domain-containing protein [Ditylenchus destructor]